MTFDPTKPVRTRNGQAARIVATDRPGMYSVVALIGEEQNPYTFTAEGRHIQSTEENPLDLLNVHERETGYFNTGDAYSSASAASSAHSGWDILEVVTEGDTVVSTRIIPHEEALDA